MHIMICTTEICADTMQGCEEVLWQGQCGGEAGKGRLAAFVRTPVSRLTFLPAVCQAHESG